VIILSFPDFRWGEPCQVPPRKKKRIVAPLVDLRLTLSVKMFLDSFSETTDEIRRGFIGIFK